MKIKWFLCATYVLIQNRNSKRHYANSWISQGRRNFYLTHQHRESLIAKLKSVRCVSANWKKEQQIFQHTSTWDPTMYTKFKESGSVQDCPRSGRPSFEEAEVKQLEMFFMTIAKQPFEKLRNNWNFKRTCPKSFKTELASETVQDFLCSATFRR